MTDEQLNSLRHWFALALTIPLEDRTAFATESCGCDDALRRELMSLLDAHESSGAFFDRLAENVIGPALAALESSEHECGEMAVPGLPHYDILERIGAGGMGIVYKARDQRLGRIVALKFLPARSARDSVARARFLSEAKAASALDHANIGVVYEIGEAGDDRPFIAMAWYDGETVRQKLRNGIIPIAEALRISYQLASALAAAHAAGIVHCDIKPANLIVTRSGQVKLVDFGIAQLLDDGMTGQTGTAGTPAYMSPEQTRGEPIDARSDLWSFGVVLYEMLAGRRPFLGEEDSSLISAIRAEAPEPLGILRPDAPAELVHVVERCLGKDRSERYANADELMAELAEVRTADRTADDKRIAAETVIRPIRRRRQFAIVAVTALSLLAVAGGAAAYFQYAGARARRVVAPTEQLRSLAVVAFTSPDSTAADNHMASGFTDELITTLGSMLDVNVSARASTSILEKKGLAPIAIGRQLGAAAVIDGTVKHEGERVSVMARLVNVSDGRVLWSRAYQRAVTDAYQVQRDIANAVANSMRLDRRPAATGTGRRLTQDIGAYEFYVKGRLAWTERTHAKVEEAIAFFRAAVERDPRFAQAHAAMGVAYINMSNFGWLPPEEGIARAEVSISRSIALDSSLAEAHSAYGFVLASRGDYSGAEASFRRAIESNPSFPWTYHYYAMLLIMLDRVDEAAAHLRSNLVLDPLSLPASATLAITHVMKGRNAEARSQFMRALSIGPEFQLTLYYFGVLSASEGRIAEATAMLEKAYRASPRFPGVAAALVYCYSRSGRSAEARAVEAGLANGERDERWRINLALAHAVLGRRDTAFAMLRNARWDVPALIELRANPLLADFRADPRYPALIP